MKKILASPADILKLLLEKIALEDGEGFKSANLTLLRILVKQQGWEDVEVPAHLPFSSPLMKSIMGEETLKQIQNLWAQFMDQLSDSPTLSKKGETILNQIQDSIALGFL